VVRIAFASLALVACSYPPLEGNPDGNPGGDGNNTQCVAPASYGAASMSSQAAMYFPPTQELPEAIQYIGKLNNASTADFVDIELIETVGGPFANGPVPATITLTGAESSTATCAGCVLVIAKCTACGIGQALTGTAYIATAGTLRITAVNPNIVGTLTDVTLRHVNIDNQGVSSFHPDNCMTRITSASFSAPVQQ
jgi:hypothetical protein